MRNIPKVTSYRSAFFDDEFFVRAFAEKSPQDGSNGKLLDDFRMEGHESQSKAIATYLSNTVLRLLSMKYNTAIPCSAAAERLFSLGEGKQKPKQSGFSDEYFKMLVFFK